MTAGALIADLRSRGVILVPDGERLRCRPRSALKREDLAALRRLKSAVLAHLRSEHHRADKQLVCFSCKESLFWRSIHGVIVCGRCHPPAAQELVAEWIVKAPDDD